MASMFGNHWYTIGQRTISVVMCLLLVMGVASCSQQADAGKAADRAKVIALRGGGVKVEEVAPPDVIQQLGLALEKYHPQVKILGPKPNETLDTTSVTVRFQVDDFPIYKDPELALGPHLHVFLDDQSYQAVYDAKQSLTFKDLNPGTHTIRAFASRPWHESFKTADAFDQLTFHVFAPTQSNHPDPGQPLLTYSRPQGDYGAEPIMLDYLITPPSHASNKDVPQALNAKTKVRVSLNGESFTTTNAQMPIYLKGFKSGPNWVKLELLNQSDQLVPNAFSETIRLITLKPNGQDTLSKLVRGELTVQEAERIVDFDISQKLAAQKPKPEPVAQPSPAGQPMPMPVVPVLPSPQASVLPSPVPSPAPSMLPSVIPKAIAPNRQPSPTPSIRVSPSPKVSAQPKQKPTVVHTNVKPSPVPSPTTIKSATPTLVPEVKASVSPGPILAPAPTSSSALNSVDEKVGKPFKNWFSQTKQGVMDQLKGDLKGDRLPSPANKPQPTSTPQPTATIPPKTTLVPSSKNSGIPSSPPEVKKVVPELKQSAPAQRLNLDLKANPDPSPASVEPTSSNPTQQPKAKVDWQKFLKLPQGKTIEGKTIDKVLMNKPEEDSGLVNSALKRAELKLPVSSEPNSAK